MKKLSSYVPSGYLGNKRMGELAELAFMYRAATRGFGVARPYGDSHPYDLLLQHGRRLLRIQVKSCYVPERGGRRVGFAIIAARHSGKKHASYGIDEIDFIAALVAPHDAWYLIPVESLGKNKRIRLYPGLKRLSRPGGLFEQYREAWHLLQDTNPEIIERPR